MVLKPTNRSENTVDQISRQQHISPSLAFIEECFVFTLLLSIFSVSFFFVSDVGTRSKLVFIHYVQTGCVEPNFFSKRNCYFLKCGCFDLQWQKGEAPLVKSNSSYAQGGSAEKLSEDSRNVIRGGEIGERKDRWKKGEVGTMERAREIEAETESERSNVNLDGLDTRTV